MWVRARAPRFSSPTDAASSCFQIRSGRGWSRVAAGPGLAGVSLTAGELDQDYFDYNHQFNLYVQAGTQSLLDEAVQQLVVNLANDVLAHM